MRHLAKSILIIFPMLLLSLLLLQGCSSLREEFQEPDIRVLGFARLPGNNLLDQRFNLYLKLSNPNDLQLDIKGIAFSFNIGETELIRGVSNNVPHIAPYGEVEFTVQGSANLIEAVRLLKKLQRHPEAAQAYQLKAKVDLAHGWPSTFNLTRDGNLRLDQLLRKE